MLALPCCICVQDYYGALDKSLRMDFKPCKKKAGYCPSK